MRADSKSAYVYRHKTADTNEVFYVGIGITKKRSWTRHGRNKYWHNVVSNHGFISEIVASDITRETAKELEEFMISIYGRRDLGNGRLVNMTAGGDGMYGISEEGRKRKADKRKGQKHSNDTKAKMSEAQKRGKHSQAKRVIDISNGIVYDCIKDAAESYGIGYHNLKDKLSGRKGCLNNTTLRYCNGDKSY